MTDPSPPPCPGTVELRQLLSGRLPPDRADAVEGHVESCPACLAQMAVLPVDNPLIREIRNGLPAVPPASPPGLDDLVLRLKHLHPTLASATAGTVEVAGVDEVVGSLAPGEGPGESGRLAHYRVLKVIGSGGMGVVFQAEDTTLGRQVALKVMRPRKERDAAGRARFLREARAMAALRHDHIAVIHQVGEVAGRNDQPIPFFAMELLVGEGLDTWRLRKERASAAQAARVGRQAAAGLAAAHAAGLIHRDVKPANLWLEPPTGWADDPPADRPPLLSVGRVKLLDFGLAAPPAEGSNEVIGTPAYMAPEQATGGPIDGRADLFGLGCVLYELCTGEPPFPGRDKLTTKLPPLRPVTTLAPDVPPRLASLIERTLAEKPADRPATAKQVERELAQFETESAGAVRKHRRAAVLKVALVVGVVAGGWAVASVLTGPKNGGPAGTAAGEDKELARLDGLQGPVNDIAFLPDGNRAVTVDATGTLRTWEAAGGRPLQAYALSDQRLLSVAVSPDGARALVGGNWAAQLCDLRSGKPVVRLPHPDEVWNLVFLPGGTGAVTACLDGRVRVWDFATARVAHELSCGKQAVWTVAVSSDGRWIASGGGGALRAQSWDYTVRLWDAATGKRLHELTGHTADVRHLAFTPDGKTLVSGGFDGTVRLWDPETGKCLRTIQAHDAFVERVAVLPDGRRVLSAGGGQVLREDTTVVSPDTAVRLWDLETGRELASWTGHRGPVRTLALTPNGTRFLSGSDDRTVRLWAVPR